MKPASKKAAKKKRSKQTAPPPERKLDASADEFVPRSADKNAAAGEARPPAPKKLRDKVCRFHANGNCKRGAQCQFRHDGPPGMAREDVEKGKEEEESKERATGAPQYACPFCEERMSDAELAVHLADVHAGDEPSQVCPICASMPGGDPNYYSQDIFGHFALRHGGQKQSQPRRRVPVKAPQPARVMKTCTAVDSSQQRLFSRGLDHIWEYAWRLDSRGQPDATSAAPCAACQGYLSLMETRVILACSCTFHTGCVRNERLETCPQCEKKIV